MKKLVILLLVMSGIILYNLKPPGPEYKLYPPSITSPGNPVALFEGKPDQDISNVMVPIPKKDRVRNRTGIQCVWASLECLGRYAAEPKLLNLTDRLDCKGPSGPGGATARLAKLGVKYDQTVRRSDRSLILKSVVKERRGCLFAIPGHAMVLVHYDEKTGIVKYINNSDPQLQIRSWTMDQFNRYWEGWILVVYADNDIIPSKYELFAAKIPIKDRNNQQRTYRKDYILSPH